MAAKKIVENVKKKNTKQINLDNLSIDLNKADVERLTQSFEHAFAKAFKQAGVIDREYVSVLRSISDSLHELKLLVEFDHERRLQAIEDYLNH